MPSLFMLNNLLFGCGLCASAFVHWFALSFLKGHKTECSHYYLDDNLKKDFLKILRQKSPARYELYWTQIVWKLCVSLFHRLVKYDVWPGSRGRCCKMLNDQNSAVRREYIGGLYAPALTECSPDRHTKGNIDLHNHDDVIKWKHFRVTGPLCVEFTGHRWIPLTKASDAQLWFFSLICAWINGWVNNHEAGDLRRHCAHYDFIVIKPNCVTERSNYCTVSSSARSDVSVKPFYHYNGYVTTSFSKRGMKLRIHSNSTVQFEVCNG